MFEKILVPLDGSPFAEMALPTAVALAQQGHHEVTLLSVTNSHHIVFEGWEGYSYLYEEQFLDASKQQFNRYLQELMVQHAQPDLQTRLLVKVGDAAGVIVDTAVEEDIDLIVMTSHGRSGVSRWVLGSVTERVLRTAPCPVLIIHQQVPLSHIMITLDGSTLSEYALKPGLELASRLGSRVTLLSVEPRTDFEPDLVPQLEEGGDKPQPPSREALFRRTITYLQHLVQGLSANLKQMIHVMAKQGPVVEVILDTIESDKVDLVVMSTHGRTGLKRWIYGSVMEKILRSAPCNMLVMRPPLEAFEPHGL